MTEANTFSYKSLLATKSALKTLKNVKSWYLSLLPVTVTFTSLCYLSLLPVTDFCQLTHVTCQLTHVTCQLSPVTCHMSPVTCHLFPVTCHLLPINLHLLFVAPKQLRLKAETVLPFHIFVCDKTMNQQPMWFN